MNSRKQIDSSGVEDLKKRRAPSCRKKSHKIWKKYCCILCFQWMKIQNCHLDFECIYDLTSESKQTGATKKEVKFRRLSFYRFVDPVAIAITSTSFTFCGLKMSGNRQNLWFNRFKNILEFLCMLTLLLNGFQSVKSLHFLWSWKRTTISALLNWCFVFLWTVFARKANIDCLFCLLRRFAFQHISGGRSI